MNLKSETIYDTDQSLPQIGWFGLVLAIGGTFCVLIISLISLTVTQGAELRARADRNQLRQETLNPLRGLIYDSEGEVLVDNKPSSNLMLDVTTFEKENLKLLAAVLQKDLIKLEEQYEKMWTTIKIDLVQKGYAHKDVISAGNPDVYLEPYLFEEKINHDQVLQFKALDIPGVFVEESLYRYYPFKELFSHILGYTGKITREDLDADNTLAYNDIIGQTGLEYQYEKDLRGKKGLRYIEVDALGRIVSEFSTNQQESVDGDSLKLTIDTKWQQKMYSLLMSAVQQHGAKGGAALIQDVETGAIKTMVSYPSFDNNLFIGGISHDDYAKIADDVRAPIMNRAIAAQLPPGSAFKTIVASAALEKKAITTSTVFNSTGVIKLSGGIPFQEYGKQQFGPLTVRDALAVSSNIFFCKTMLALGIDPFDELATKFGVGEYTGIDVPGEMPGRLPSPKNKITLAKQGAYWLEPIWYPDGDSCNAAIGQGITLMTPVQLVSVASTIANGGKVMQPYVVGEVIDAEGKAVRQTTPVIKEQGFIKEANLKVVREGMLSSVSGPRRIIVPLNIPEVKVAAKTGTAEFGIKDEHGYLSSHAWVMGFYPYDKPKYSFVVVLEGGGKSNRAAEVMAEWLKSFY